MKDIATPPEAPLRSPDHVMRLSQLGAMFPTRLSFLRVLLRDLAKDNAEVERLRWDICAEGYGCAVYTLTLGGREYSLVAFSQPLADANRTDRVIATAWDAAFVLYDGVPSADEVARLAAEVPKQEAGRFTERDLVLSRANKSVRLWAEIVETLKKGGQPDARRLNAVGYLMRTTAVYGNGKFGIADRTLYETRPGLSGPFAAEMLTVWLIRGFTHDLIEHVAGAQLDRSLKRHLGIGNATGLGMAPFLVTHPVLLNNWMMVRETAIARVRAVDSLSEAEIDRLLALRTRVEHHLGSWHPSEDAHRKQRDTLEYDFISSCSYRDIWNKTALAEPCALARIMDHAANFGPEVEELTLALLLEPFGDLIDGLADCMADPFGPVCDPVADTEALQHMIETHAAWALGRDYEAAEECQQFWYVSEEKLEPRLGNRFEEAGAELESPLDIARRIAALHTDLPKEPQPLAAFLTQHPDHLLAVERVQIAQRYPYADIRDNLIAATCRPIDMLRSKLAMFGATKFDPKSNLWTRITLAQGAPLADELGTDRVDDWWLPEIP